MKKFLGLMAVAAAMTIAASVERAEALSLINPAGVGAAKHASENLVIEVRRGGGFRGGGFRAAGFRGGFHRGGFHGGRHFHRHHFHRPHFHHRRFYGPRFYYGAPVIYPRRCRIVWTDFGPRRICRRPFYPYYYY